MAKKRRSHSTIRSTSPVAVSFGAFHIGGYRVPYMSSILRLGDVAEWFNLVTDDPKYAYQDWTVEELFQREVDHSRVVDIADNYLSPKRANRPPFFNSLTVVLCPREEYEDEYVAPDEVHEYPQHLKLGPIVIDYEESEEDKYPRNGTFGTLKWNRDQVHAIAIDGQHRLAAIKRLYAEDREATKRSMISVIFILLEREAGVIAPNLERLHLMRSIFIDLNKHAVPVSRARNLLLDDNDPAALFLRTLFGPQLEYKPQGTKKRNGFKVGENGEFDCCLPLNLVDWHGEFKSKVETGPYVTSVLALDKVVDWLLASKHPKHGRIDVAGISPDEDDYYEQIKKMLSPWTKSWEGLIRAHWEECAEHEAPLILGRDELQMLSREFNELWGRPIVRLLTTAGPYRELAQKRIQSDTLTPQFGQWFQAHDAFQQHENRAAPVRDHYKHCLDKIENSFREKGAGAELAKFKKIAKEIDDKIKEDSIFFLLVGQRALVLAMVALVESKEGPDWAKHAKIKLDNFRGCFQDFYAHYLTEAVNAIHAKSKRPNGTFYKQCQVKRHKDDEELLDPVNRAFWAGSLVRRDDPSQVDFSMAGAKRGAKWFTLISHLYRFMRCNPSVVGKDFAGHVRDWDLRKIQGHKDFGAELAEAMANVVGQEDGSYYNSYPMAFLVAPHQDEDEEWPIEMAKRAAAERILHLMGAFDLK